MVFVPPPFTQFRAATLNLDTNYSTVLGRYKIIPDSQNQPSFSTPSTSLDILIDRTTAVIKCKSKRTTQLEVFSQLVRELKQIPKTDEEKIKQATLFLLGALIHRYFRLIKEYDEFNKYTLWACAVTDCTLFKAIRIALQLKEPYRWENTFKKDDMEILDEVTIVTALKVFHDNMLLEDEKGKPRFMKYPHFSTDKHFIRYLKDIIDEHTERGKHYLKQFKAIAYIQSLAKQIDKDQRDIEGAVRNWHMLLLKDHKDFSQLNLSLLEDHLNKKVPSEPLKNRILDLLNTPRMKEKLNQMDHSLFLQEMLFCNQAICSYTLFGGYTLLLSQALDRELLSYLQKALCIENDPNQLTAQDKLNGINFFKIYMENEPGIVLNYEFFDGKEKMNTLMAQMEIRLTLEVREGRPQVGLHFV